MSFIYAYSVSKEKVKFILKEVLIFIVQVALSRVQFGQIFPLGLPFSIVRIFLGGNLLVVTIEYAVANIFLVTDFYLLISAAFEIVILSLYYFFKEMFKVKRKRLFLTLFVALSSMVKLYLMISGKFFWQNYLIELACKLVFVFFLLKLFAVYQKKFIFLKCSNLDYLLFSTFVVLFVLGLFQYQFLADFLGLCLFASTIILCCRFLPTDKFLIFSLTVSLCFGYIFASSKLVIISAIIIVLMISISRLYKYLYLSLMLLVLFVSLKVSNELVLTNIISLASSLIIVTFVPQKLINKLIEFFEDKNLNIIKENLWQEKEKDIKQNLMLMSRTLSKMQEDFRFLIVGKIDRKYAASELAKDVMRRCCENCENKILCANSLIDKQNLLSEYVYYAIMKGGISIEQLSIGFKTYCNKTNVVVHEINALSTKFVEFETSVKNEDESKLLISTELGNFANLFKNFAKNIDSSPKLNKNLSLVTKEMLTNNMIEVGDIGVFETKDGIEKIDVVAENNVMLRRELSETLSKVVRGRVQIKKLKHLDFSGLSLVSFALANELRAEFAVSTSSKESVSGDNTLISRIDDNRFFIAIADGMGHGKVAGKTSNMILELIKNLFYIGIDLEVIIDSINKLLLPVGLDNFSTLDAAIVDLRTSKCTFIKLGSSVSAIKHKDKTEIVTCESLPVGIVQNLKPTISVCSIQAGDMIVLASDGVVDSFGEIENYKIFINDCQISNLQRFTDNVIFELGMQPNKHKDDMSIIALKLLKNSGK